MSKHTHLCQWGLGAPKGSLGMIQGVPESRRLTTFTFNFIHTPHSDSVTESVTFQSEGVKEPGTKCSIISVLGQFSGQFGAPRHPEVVKPLNNTVVFPTWKEQQFTGSVLANVKVSMC